MDREAFLTMLTSRYGGIAAEAGMTLLDEAAGFGPVLDRIAGFLDTYPDLDMAWQEPLARYVTLDYLADRLTTQMNISRGGNSYQLNQLFTNVTKLLDMARERVAWIVEPTVPSTTVGGVGAVSYWTTPFLTDGGDDE